MNSTIWRPAFQPKAHAAGASMRTREVVAVERPTTGSWVLRLGLPSLSRGLSASQLVVSMVGKTRPATSRPPTLKKCASTGILVLTWTVPWRWRPVLPVAFSRATMTCWAILPMWEEVLASSFAWAVPSLPTCKGNTLVKPWSLVLDCQALILKEAFANACQRETHMSGSFTICRTTAHLDASRKMQRLRRQMARRRCTSCKLATGSSQSTMLGRLSLTRSTSLAMQTTKPCLLWCNCRSRSWAQILPWS
mmetsp:Transcript_7168/g.16274  ORF Transcript_7168/g.16274 Transcript_7168/m.16274 type:complete len:250 (-) Transcript_7168:182-931(-)